MSVTAELVHPKSERRIGFRRVLFATDFSDASERALTYSVALAARYGAELFVVHAIEPEPREAIPLDPLPRELDRERLSAEKEMKRFVKNSRLKDFSYHPIVARGDVWSILSDLIEREHVDLLVLGTHGRKGMAKLVLGSVAEQVLHAAPCPVLTVGPSVPLPSSGDFHEILFATDFESASANALPYALMLAEDYQAQLILLHMVEPMPVADIAPAAYGPPVFAAQELAKWQNAKRRESQARLRALIPADAELATPPVFEVGMDFLAEGILDTAREYKADLIVMGSNRTDSPRLVSRFPWALTSEVIRKARSPVLTVRN